MIGTINWKRMETRSHCCIESCSINRIYTNILGTCDVTNSHFFLSGVWCDGVMMRRYLYVHLSHFVRIFGCFFFLSVTSMQQLSVRRSYFCSFLNEDISSGQLKHVKESKLYTIDDHFPVSEYWINNFHLFRLWNSFTTNNCVYSTKMCRNLFHRSKRN